ncbi:MAG: tRNA dihydrouridine synthase DusB [Desulfobacteraceae bacterium]|nr:MAG: tRNA dihydrouridine synthase DusB [Desulfobacteraceae bacterium]
MKIGSVSIPNNTVMAPLAGITNLPFRLMVKDLGCGLVCSEMISANGLVYQSPKTVQLMDSTDAEKPISVQVFGAVPEIMAEAAKIIEDSGADILDINFGCSVRKIIKSGSGAALMKNPEIAGAILAKVKKAITIPLTIKIRSGWDYSGDQAIEIARIAEDCGVDAITVHPRTATQGFGGKADWSLIQKVKACLSIPVIGNGDITCADDAVRMIQTTGCDGVMIGRAAIGNPFVFPAIQARLSGNPEPVFDTADRFQIMKRYLDDTVTYFGEMHACRMMRSRLCWFVKGLPHAATFRDSIKQIATRQEAIRLMTAYQENLEDRN